MTVFDNPSKMGNKYLLHGFLTFFMVLEELDTPQKTRILYTLKVLFERFLMVFENPPKTGNKCILYGFLMFFNISQRSKIFLKEKEWMYTLRVFDGF
jgi:hypothetical protein